MKPSLHYLALAGAIALGAALRFWHLDLKPLWMDEVITALFSLGRSYYNVPLEVVAPLAALDQVFTLNPAATCAQIAQTVATESVHPPLFFCLMHSWLNWVGAQTWWQLRALPALLGVGAIAAIYGLNRVAFSPAAGLMGAAVMAVSPFAVYLSQEARHYTLPMLLIILALLGLICMQQDCQRQRLRPAVWLGWAAVNAIGFYVHYFFILAFVAQVVTLLGLMYWQRQGLRRRAWGALALAVGGVMLSYLPWMPTFLSHIHRPETNWLIPFKPSWVDKVVPLYQIPAGWLIMVISLPVENQPIWIAVPSAVAMLLFAIWLGWQVYRGLRNLWQNPQTHLATLTLVSFTLVVLLEFLGIVYILGKDITVVFRYNFTYYPAFCALLGASLVNLPAQFKQASKTRWQRYLDSSPRQVQASVLLVGLLSCCLIAFDLVFQKPYFPQRVAKDINFEPARPVLVVGGYETLFEIALGLSFDLELHQHYRHTGQNPPAYFAFLPRTAPTYAEFWQRLSTLQLQASSDSQANQPASVASLPANSRSLTLPLNLWIVGPGLVREQFPPQLSLPGQLVSSTNTPVICQLDPTQHHRIGIPYQLYRC